MSGKREIRKTLEPKLATLSATYLLAPCTIETTIIKVETERITPRSVRNDLNLWVRKVSRAISIGSLSDTGRRAERTTPCSVVTLVCNETLCCVAPGICILSAEGTRYSLTLPMYKTKI